MKEIKIKIETLNGTSLVNNNLVNVINSGIVTMSRINLPDNQQGVSIRDINSDLVEITIKLDAVNVAKLIECVNAQ